MASKEQIEKWIDRYNINIYEKNGEKKIGIVGIYADMVMKDGVWDEIRPHKAEIIEVIEARENAKREAAEARRRKIDAIPGLKEIKAAIADLNQWQYEFDKSFESEAGGGTGVRMKPQYDLDKMLADHPWAAAYLKAEEYSYKENYELAAIGTRALERVIKGDWEAAMADFEADMERFVQKHMYD